MAATLVGTNVTIALGSSLVFIVLYVAASIPTHFITHMLVFRGCTLTLGITGMPRDVGSPPRGTSIAVGILSTLALG